jgi:hypothetical protein
MKFIIVLTFICTSFFSFSQTDAILTYENNYSDKIATGKVVTTIYESKEKARVESTNTQTSSSFGPPKTESQNILIFDFTAQKETHLNAKQNIAAVMPFMVTTMEKQMMPALGVDYVVQNLGAETVNGYKCTHFTIITTSSKNKNYPPAKKDVWITNDIGSNNLFFAGPYLYLPLGSYEATKLVDAGGTGIVVKWQVMDPISNQPNICTLTNYQPGKLKNDIFSAPSNYTIVQH